MLDSISRWTEQLLARMDAAVGRADVRIVWTRENSLAVVDSGSRLAQAEQRLCDTSAMAAWGTPGGFTTLCEIEPATTPDLRHVRRQVALLDGVADACLVPDNHIGRATVSSIAVAGEVIALGGTAVACVNSRDRNLLGFRRDLLTAAAYGVRDFLFVRGDDAPDAVRSGDLTVGTMMREARAYEHADFRVGVTAVPALLCRAGSRPPTSCWCRCPSTSRTCSAGGRPWTSTGPCAAKASESEPFDDVS